MKIGLRGVELESVLGIHILVSWSVIPGLLIFDRLRFRPVIWMSLVALIAIHEVGHALLVRYLGHRVDKIVIHGYGGFCRWTGDPAAFEVAAVAWGGVCAQVLALGAALLLPSVFPVLAESLTRDFFEVFVLHNTLLIAFNLLPVRPLDGYHAWRLFNAKKLPRPFESTRARTQDIGEVLRRLDETEVQEAHLEQANSLLRELMSKKRSAQRPE